MSDTIDVRCLYTRVRCATDVPWTFSYLNMTLEPQEEVYIFGNIVEAVSNRGADRASSVRYMQALQRDLQSGRLEIVNTPSVILYDAVRQESKALSLEDGSLVVKDPCWMTGDTYSGPLHV